MTDCQHIDIDCFRCIFLGGLNDFSVSFSQKYNNREKDCYSMCQTYRIYFPFLGLWSIQLVIINKYFRKEKGNMEFAERHSHIYKNRPVDK